MTYGIDQCRKCGQAMAPAGPEQAVRYEQSRRQKPTMGEAEWRAKGWKAAPTRYQMTHPIDGVCKECKWTLRNHAAPKYLMLIVIFGIGLVMFVILYILQTGVL